MTNAVKKIVQTNAASFIPLPLREPRAEHTPAARNQAMEGNTLCAKPKT